MTAVKKRTLTNPARLRRYDEIQKLLYRRLRPRYPKTIGVLSLEGAIVPGTSRHSPFPLPITGETTIGSATVQQQLRSAREDESLAAVILHVDSPGGSALASDLIWRELKLLDQTKPLIVYMGGVAASGGYYIAAPGRKIVAQRSTITGSIGVIVTKPVTQGLYDKLDAHTESIQRGDNADLYTTDTAWTTEQYKTVEAGVRHFYIGLQATSRRWEIEYDSLDEICNGRVWTGVQAQEHGLVDEIGDFSTAWRWPARSPICPQTARSLRRKSRRPSTPCWLLRRRPRRHGSASGPMPRQATCSTSLTSGELGRTLQSEHIWFLADDLPDLR